MLADFKVFKLISLCINVNWILAAYKSWAFCMAKVVEANNHVGGDSSDEEVCE